jgi:peptidoglycan/xylan/chitin deacetylase (PgdA/CDA1 family)
MPRFVPILMYHALSPARTPGFAQWTLTPERFRGHLDYLSGNGYHAVTVAQLTAIMSGREPAPADNLVALTFDDAYVDFQTTALPLLAEYGMPATLFVPTAYVGGKSGWMIHENEGDRPVLSWSAIAEVAASGMIEIGSHSHSHPQFDRLPTERLAGETVRPKELLEDKLGKAVTSFAYPFGRFDRRAHEAVAAAGYTAGCTMLAWSATPGDHPLELPRVSIFQDTDADALARRLAGYRNPLRRPVLRGERAVRAFQQERMRRRNVTA